MLLTDLNTPGNFVNGLSLAQKGAIGYEVASTGFGAYDSTRNLLGGCASPLDALSFLPLAGYAINSDKVGDIFDSVTGFKNNFDVFSFKLSKNREIIEKLPQAKYGHTGISFDGGNKIYGFNPDISEISHCQRKDAIALVEIVSVNSTNTEIYGKLLKLFKGDQNWFKKNWCGHIYFESASGWFQACFKKNEKALVLLDKVNKSLVVYSRDDKLIINVDDNIALSSYRDREVYWTGFHSWYTNNLLAVNWEEIDHFLINL